MQNEDLWDFEALPLPETKSPAEILKEQAGAFNTKMSGSAIFAEVNSLKTLEQNRLSFALDLVVPALGDYKLRVVRCSFRLSSNYPVKVYSDFGDAGAGLGVPEVTEEEFSECLRSTFVDPKLRSSIASLVANARI